MKLSLVKGSTNVTLYVFIQDSSVTTGAGLTGLVWNSASLVASQVRPLADRVAITLVTQTVTGAHTDGGFVEVDATNTPGVYRLDLPDAVCATGVDSVVVMLKGATNMAPVVLEIQLTTFDLNTDTIGTCTTNADMRGTDSAATAAALAVTDAVVDTIKTETALIVADTNELQSDDVPGILSAQNDLSAAQVNAECDTALADYDAPTKAEMDTAHALLATPAQVNTQCDTAIADAKLKTPIRSGTAQAGANGTITLDASASATNNFYNNAIIQLTGGLNPNQSRVITGYDGTTKVATISPAWHAAPDNTTTFSIWPPGYDATAVLTEAYAADGSQMTLAQALYEINQTLSEFAIDGTTVTVKKRDGSTTALTFTLDHATNPTSRTRAT